MGCCQSQLKGKGGLDDKRRVIDHFMPPGASQQPRFTYRLEKVEELDMERLRSQNRVEMRNMASADLAAAALMRDRPVDIYAQFDEDGALEDQEAEDPSMPLDLDSKSAVAKAALLDALGQQLQDRLGTHDAPVVGEERYLLVETAIGTGSTPFVTRPCSADEETLVREVQEEALKGMLFVSNTLALATYEKVGDTARPILLEPLSNDSGVDFEAVLDTARDKGMSGWRLRGALRGRSQVQELVLEYAMFADVVVSPFSHLVFSQHDSPLPSHYEMVELRATGGVITGALIRIVRAWARRGWRLISVLYNIVTTYDKVTMDPPETAATNPDMHTDMQFSAQEIGGNGDLRLYYNVAIYFERRMAATDQGKMQAHLALQERQLAVQTVHTDRP